MRTTPYTERGVRRLACFRCGEPASEQWSICSDYNQWRPLCLDCDISLNKMILKWAGDPLWKEKMQEYKLFKQF